MVKKMKSYKVLIVEDEATYIHSIQKALVTSKKRKFEVVALTNNSVEAWELIKEKKPDAVVVDLQLKKGGGLSLLEKIREQADELAVVPYTVAIAKLASTQVIEAATHLSDYLYKEREGFINAFVVKHLELVAKGSSKTIEAQRHKAQTELEESQQEVVMEPEINVMRERIDRELDKYCISHRGRGRTYLAEAINMIASIATCDLVNLTDIYNKIADMFGVEVKSIDHTIRRTIHKTWQSDSAYMRDNAQVQLMDVKIPTNKDFMMQIANKMRTEDSCD